MSDRDEFTPDDAEIEELLRKVGPRSEPSAEATHEVHAAVHAEWRALIDARRHRRRSIVFAIAAALCALAIGVAITVQMLNVEGEPIAVLLRADGDVLVASAGNAWTRVDAGHRIAIGDSVRSDARGALQLDNGIALRIDRGTSFKIVDEDRLMLHAGAVYVDAKPGEASAAFVIDTAAGSVRHLGTQYEVRKRADGIDVSVREGRVMVESRGGNDVAATGERLEVSTLGSVQRHRIAPTDEHWRWVTAIAPAFTLENAPLAAFLEWAARETGRKLAYESPQAEALAASFKLHGSIDGLSPEAALTAVLATTPLRLKEPSADVLEVIVAGD